jgi:hypothetical protein
MYVSDHPWLKQENLLVSSTAQLCGSFPHTRARILSPAAVQFVGQKNPVARAVIFSLRALIFSFGRVFLPFAISPPLQTVSICLLR